MEKFTGMLVLFTAVYSGVSIWQGYIAQQSADVAKRAADIAKDSFDSTVKSFRLDQRAWVGVTEYPQPELKAGRVAYTVAIKNVGKTPALKILPNLSFDLVPEGKGFSPTYEGERRSCSMLQPGMTLAVPTAATLMLEEDQVEFLKSGRLTLYLYGKISYEDVFDRAYCSTFCVFYDRNMEIQSCNYYNKETEGRCQEQECIE